MLDDRIDALTERGEIMKKIKVGILCGGRSSEHQVSLQSARNIVDAIDRNRYEVVLIGIDRAGQWHLGDSAEFLLNPHDPERIALNRLSETVTLAPGAPGNPMMTRKTHRPAGDIDVIFPVLHGPFGEDGTVQGLLKLANLPFVGAGVLGSAVSMDKDVMKRLLRDAGIGIPDFVAFASADRERIEYEKVRDRLGMPCFIKPANLGSSVGITKARDAGEFEAGVREAFRYDRKILVEEYIRGREIECAVLGNARPEASGLGEVQSTHEFYSYEAKYIDEHGARLNIPAALSPGLTDQIRATAVKVHRTLACEGMSRVDFFLRDDGAVLVNELNAIPGFTRISMFPKLWEAAGVTYGDLIDRLIQLALERFDEEKLLET